MTTNEQIIKKWNPKLQASVITDNWSSAKEILSMAVIEARADERANFLTKHPHDYAYQLGKEDGKKEGYMEVFKEVEEMVGTMRVQELKKKMGRLNGNKTNTS